MSTLVQLGIYLFFVKELNEKLLELDIWGSSLGPNGQKSSFI
jgi:hypothetical protein